MDGIGGHCKVELIGGRAVDVAAVLGDEIKVELGTVESGLLTVFSGEVTDLWSGSEVQVIEASDGLLKLARLDVESAFEEVNVDFIVKELLNEVDIPSGQIEKGPKLASYVIRRGPRAFHHIKRLAELCGADFFTDGEGKAHFVTSVQSGTSHDFKYGESIIELKLHQMPDIHDAIQVWGDGAASSQGADKYYWLPCELDSVAGEAALVNGSLQSNLSGERTRQYKNGAIRSGEAATIAADGYINRLVNRRVRGSMLVFSAPSVMPADMVNIQSLPDGHLLRSVLSVEEGMRVRSVSHRLDKTHGFVTRMEF